MRRTARYAPAVLIVVGISLAVAVMAAGRPADVTASTTCNMVYLDAMDGAASWNYDFHEQNFASYPAGRPGQPEGTLNPAEIAVGCWARGGAVYYTVDWAETLFFMNDASKPRVYGLLSGWSCPGGGVPCSDAYGLSYSGCCGGWSTSGGVKDHIPWNCFESNAHIRLYAPPGGESAWSSRFGYHMWGVTHHDMFEVPVDPDPTSAPECPEKWFGLQESAAQLVAAKIAGQRDRYGWPYKVEENWGYIHNLEQFRIEKDHHWYNDGFSTYVDLTWQP